MSKRVHADSSDSGPSTAPDSLRSNEDLRPPELQEGSPSKFVRDSKQRAPKSRRVAECRLPPHKPISFSSFLDLEKHVAAEHTNRCLECQRNMPTGHFLDLHIAENHDPLAAARRERGEKIYACFVEGCDKVCADWHRRKMHMIDKHMFPLDYDFFIVNDGLGKRRTMLRTFRAPKRKPLEAPDLDSNVHDEGHEHHETTDGDKEDISIDSESAEDASSRSEEIQDSDMSDLTETMAKLRFVPRHVKFGRSRGRGGFAKR